MGKIRNYLQDVVKEMRKVSWPKRKELIDNTIVTLLATAALSLFTFGADRVISTVLSVFYG